MNGKALTALIMVVSICAGLVGGSMLTKVLLGEYPVQMIMRWHEQDKIKNDTSEDLQDINKSTDIPPSNNDNTVSNIKSSLSDISFEKHQVTSGIGDKYLFDILVGNTTKDVMNKVSSDELTEFLSGIDFDGTNGNAVIMFEDGTGISVMEASRTYTANYGHIDISDGEFTIVERLGAIWNDNENGWYYMTVDEMRQADAAD